MTKDNEEEQNSVDYLLKEFRRVMKHARIEHSISYAAMIGCLDILKHDLLYEELKKSKRDTNL